ncbi:MAG: hypothetical protein L3K13_02030 [Thermoplasmata archaeon]|nr:hypothetical protein [Thermoplasmata archaeon]
MRTTSGRARLWALLTLQRTRSLLAPLPWRLLVGAISLLYAAGAMVVGRMLYFPSHAVRGGWFLYVYPSGPGPSWMYPAILAGGPNFELALPMTSGILMTLSAAGVGLGMALAALLIVRLWRERRTAVHLPTAVGSAAGLTPALLALLTLGACCSTTAAATAGIGLAAQSTGTTASAALANAWYLGVFQVSVIFVALLAQEQLVAIYGVLFRGPDGEAGSAPSSPRPTQLGARGAASGLLRVCLVVAGVTWSLAALPSWFTNPHGATAASRGVSLAFLHFGPGLLAVLLALFPVETLAAWRRLERTALGTVLRGSLLAGGLALLTWLPPPLDGAGGGGLGNELLGFAGLPASWGAVAPPALLPIALFARWGLQFLLLGSFAVAVGIAPETAVRALRWSSAAPRTDLSTRRLPARAVRLSDGPP